MVTGKCYTIEILRSPVLRERIHICNLVRKGTKLHYKGKRHIQNSPSYDIVLNGKNIQSERDENS